MPHCVCYYSLALLGLKKGFESETRAGNEDQISFISIWYPKAERSCSFDCSRGTEKLA